VVGWGRGVVGGGLVVGGGSMVGGGLVVHLVRESCYQWDKGEKCENLE
jgi:hypothetical protein